MIALCEHPHTYRMVTERPKGVVGCQTSSFEATADNPVILSRMTDGLATAGATAADATLVHPAAVSAFDAGFVVRAQRAAAIGAQVHRRDVRDGPCSRRRHHQEDDRCERCGP